MRRAQTSLIPQLLGHPLDLGMQIQRSVALLQANEPPEGYIGLFSGGKDSVTIKELARQAGVRVRWQHNLTTIDPPEVYQFMREHHPDVEIRRSPHGNFFRRMEEKGIPPTRRCRWCCDEFKERNGPKGCRMIIGVRASESASRSDRYQKCVDDNYPAGRVAVLPIRLWSDSDVWRYIGYRKLATCSLYQEGFSRIGCIACPLAGQDQQRREFARWPRYRDLWQLSFRRMYERHHATKRLYEHMASWRDLWRWWIGEEVDEDGNLIAIVPRKRAGASR